MEKFLNVVLQVLMVVVNTTLMMFTLSSFWLWFVSPLGVPTIDMAHAFGLSLIVTYFQVRNPKFFKPELLIKRTFMQRFGYNFGITLMGLLLGYVTSLFM